MPSHLPAYQWYPGDWRKDPAVQMLSYEDRGIWRELIDFMHEAEPRGCLQVHGRWLNDDQVAKLLGIGSTEWKQSRSRLEAAGVPGVDEETGGLYSRRMVRDEALRLQKAEAGRKGGKASRPPSSPKQKGSKPKAPAGSKPEAKRGSSVSVSSSKEKNKQKRKTAETPQTQKNRTPTQPSRASQLDTVKRLLRQQEDEPSTTLDDLPDIGGKG